MKKYYTKNDVLGYAGFNYQRQNELLKIAGITLEAIPHNGRRKHVYTAKQFAQILKAAGWVQEGNSYYPRKIDLGEQNGQAD